jgi:hypothetical protein
LAITVPDARSAPVDATVSAATFGITGTVCVLQLSPSCFTNNAKAATAALLVRQARCEDRRHGALEYAKIAWYQINRNRARLAELAALR